MCCWQASWFPVAIMIGLFNRLGQAHGHVFRYCWDQLSLYAILYCIWNISKLLYDFLDVFRFLCISVIFSPLVTLVVLSVACCLQHGKKTVRQHFVRVGLMVNSSHPRTKRRPGKVVEATMVMWSIYTYLIIFLYILFFLCVCIYIYKYTYTYIYAWLLP
jgi:hypothetical protein